MFWRSLCVCKIIMCSMSDEVFVPGHCTRLLYKVTVEGDSTITVLVQQTQQSNLLFMTPDCSPEIPVQLCT